MAHIILIKKINLYETKIGQPIIKKKSIHPIPPDLHRNGNFKLLSFL